LAKPPPNCASWANPALVGTAQVRGVRFEGERMILRPPPRTIDGVVHHRELSWERISPV
jgi:hypothetical protein